MSHRGRSLLNDFRRIPQAYRRFSICAGCADFEFRHWLAYTAESEAALKQPRYPWITRLAGAHRYKQPPETAKASRRDQKMRTRMPELTPKEDIAPKVNWGQY